MVTGPTVKACHPLKTFEMFQKLSGKFRSGVAGVCKDVRDYQSHELGKEDAFRLLWR